jgi:hypothetical protein
MAVFSRRSDAQEPAICVPDLNFTSISAPSAGQNWRARSLQRVHFQGQISDGQLDVHLQAAVPMHVSVNTSPGFWLRFVNYDGRVHDGASRWVPWQRSEGRELLARICLEKKLRIGYCGTNLPSNGSFIIRPWTNLNASSANAEVKQCRPLSIQCPRRDRTIRSPNQSYSSA